MWPYLIMSSITVLMTYFAEREMKKEHKVKALLYSVFIIVVPCVLAGCRGDSVGTDIHYYAQYVHKKASESSAFNEMLSLYRNNGIEIGYLFFAYVIAKLSLGFQWFLFATELVVMIFVYKTLMYYRNMISITLGMTIFLNIFYGQSLNLMRQYMAMAIVLYASRFILEKKPINYILSIVIASLFHASAWIGIGFLLLYYYLQWNKIERFSYAKKIVLLISIVIISLIGWSALVNLVVETGIIKEKYFQYLYGTVYFDITYVIICIPKIVVMFFALKRTLHKYIEAFYIQSIGILSIFLAQISSISTFSSRIVLYFNMFDMVILAMLISGIKMRTNRYIVGGLVVLYSVFYFIYIYIIWGWSEIYPYVTFWS